MACHVDKARRPTATTFVMPSCQVRPRNRRIGPAGFFLPSVTVLPGSRRYAGWQASDVTGLPRAFRHVHGLGHPWWERRRNRQATLPSPAAQRSRVSYAILGRLSWDPRQQPDVRCSLGPTIHPSARRGAQRGERGGGREGESERVGAPLHRGNMARIGARQLIGHGDSRCCWLAKLVSG